MFNLLPLGMLCEMTASGNEWEGRSLTPGTAEGTVLVLEKPLSFWGGMDVRTGTVIDERHPQHGIRLTGRIVVMSAGRGSSSSTSVLAEAIRLGTAPAAIVLTRPDVIVALAPIVTTELYGRGCPVVCLDGGSYCRLKTGMRLRIQADDVTAKMWIGIT